MSSEANRNPEDYMTFSSAENGSDSASQSDNASGTNSENKSTSEYSPVVVPSKSDDSLNWFSRLFQPKVNFYKLLGAQAKTTSEGMEALREWIEKGASDRCQPVRDLEHRADQQKLLLQKQLSNSFITPFDREDIYDLSTQLDEVINAAKTTAREIEALNYCPFDPTLSEMAKILCEGARCLLRAFENLDTNLGEASKQAKLARKAENRFEKVYRIGMRELFEMNDVKTILRTVEVYRAMITAAHRIDVVGEKLDHVIIKLD